MQRKEERRQQRQAARAEERHRAFMAALVPPPVPMQATDPNHVVRTVHVYDGRCVEPALSSHDPVGLSVY